MKIFSKDELEDQRELSIQSKIVDEDIRSFVRGRLESDRKLKGWHQHAEMREEIEKKLVEKSGGM